MQNIRFGKENVSDTEIIEATKEANAYDFIMQLPKVSYNIRYNKNKKIIEFSRNLKP